MIWYWHSLFRVFTGVYVVGLILWLALDTAQRPEQLTSLAGIFLIILILFACSKHHSAVSFGDAGWAKGRILPITKYMCQIFITKVKLSSLQSLELAFLMFLLLREVLKFSKALDHLFSYNKL